VTVRTIVLDIEGTITDVAFVTSVLFPFARRALPDFVRAHGAEPEVAAALAAVAEASGIPPGDTEALVAELDAWAAADRKDWPLKTLQGLVWRHGFEGGQLRGHLYDEVPATLRAWKAAGRRLVIYSSGSVEAQKLLFRHSVFGDLSGLFDAHYDSRIGAKVEAASYAAIAAALGEAAEAILFLSDNPRELEAARAAGWHVAELRREPGAAAGTAPQGWPVATDLDGVALP